VREERGRAQEEEPGMDLAAKAGRQGGREEVEAVAVLYEPQLILLKVK